jgi:hypothetical protein
MGPEVQLARDAIDFRFAPEVSLLQPRSTIGGA